MQKGITYKNEKIPGGIFSGFSYVTAYVSSLDYKSWIFFNVFVWLSMFWPRLQLVLLVHVFFDRNQTFSNTFNCRKTLTRLNLSRTVTRPPRWIKPLQLTIYIFGGDYFKRARDFRIFLWNSLFECFHTAIRAVQNAPQFRYWQINILHVTRSLL